MAILFYQEKQKRIYITLAVLILILIFALFWFKFLRGSLEKPLSISPDSLDERSKRIQINFGKLEDQILKDLHPFTPIVPPQGEFGRDNPFAPYEATSTPNTP